MSHQNLNCTKMRLKKLFEILMRVKYGIAASLKHILFLANHTTQIVATLISSIKRLFLRGIQVSRSHKSDIYSQLNTQLLCIAIHD